MKRPAVFFDRDNTLIANDGYLGDPAQVKLIEGAADAVAKVRGLGYAAVVFSNQSGVARGMFGEDAVHAVNSRLDELLQDHNPAAVIDRHEFCPHHPEARVEEYRSDSELRKPRPGMILQAARQLALDLPRSWVIGDAMRDIEAGRAAGCRTILLKPQGVPASPAALESSDVAPDHEVANLKEATAIIESNPPPPTAEDVTIEPPAPEAVPAAVPESQELSAVPSTVKASAVPPVESSGRALEMQEAMERDESPPISASAPSSTIRGSSATTVPQTDDLEEEPANLVRLKGLAEQILEEIRRFNQHTISDFSVSKLLAGIVQILTLAALFFAYLRWSTPDAGNILLVTLILQTMTIALLIMGRQH